MAIRLRQIGLDDFAVLERSHALGGTWRDNTYPGCAVDVQSHLYSYSFAPNPDWSQGDLTSVEVRQEDQDAYNLALRQRLAGTVWTSGGCGSWYLDPDGGTSIIWPGYTWQFRRALRAFDPAVCHLRPAAVAVSQVAS